MPSNGSVLGVTLQHGEASALDFVWEFPVVNDDI